MAVFYEYTKPFSHKSLANELVWDKQTLLLYFKLQGKKTADDFVLHAYAIHGWLSDD
jgi:hypothetical protein